ncbi:hypothetical protein ANO11243_080020 [Dothideomycetidae sp. 11243]|nr:hypothetical protein ANO11243_080020 [fungal sp. No.11243]
MVNPGLLTPALVDSACDPQHVLKVDAGSTRASATTARVLPVGDDNLVVSPSLEKSLQTSITPLPDTNTMDPLHALVQPALPGSAAAPQVITPASESAPLLDLPSMDTVVGACIAPISQSSALHAPAQSSKTSPGLRLPSFEALGIANPHSTAPGAHPSPFRNRLSDPVPAFLDGLESLGGEATSCPITRTWSLDADHTSPPPIRLASHLFETLTPPDDTAQVLWSSLAPSMQQDISGRPMNQTGRPQLRPSLAAGPVTPVSASSETPNVPRIEIQRSMSDNTRVQIADQQAVANLRSSPNPGDPLKVLSHALPCPSPTGFIFPSVISSLQANTVGSPLCWINVFHALPGKFGMNDVPTSPPSTPDPPVGGQDYFTSMTFDSAVRVLDYQDNLTSMPRSPHPIVPPATISVSIIERYIPPTNSNEYAEMFMIGGRSLLVDRLVELSMHNGTLLFIYPTRSGAETFTRQYLGPILDPLLRTMRTLHHLPVDLAASLGKMSAVSSMLEFDDLHRRLAVLCEQLGQDNPQMRRFSSGQSKFVIDMAQKQSVNLERSVWAERWWTKQEKSRIRDTVNQYFRIGHRVSSQSDITPTSMIHAVLDGVASRPYPMDRIPGDGVEVGVFVIRRVMTEG